MRNAAIQKRSAKRSPLLKRRLFFTGLTPLLVYGHEWSALLCFLKYLIQTTFPCKARALLLNKISVIQINQVHTQLSISRCSKRSAYVYGMYFQSCGHVAPMILRTYRGVKAWPGVEKIRASISPLPHPRMESGWLQVI